MAKGDGAPGNPWKLTTPLGSAQFEIHCDDGKQVLHRQVGSTWLHYQLRAS